MTEAQKRASRKYFGTPKWRANRDRYIKSDKGKATLKKINRRTKLRLRYGITEDQFEQMLIKQDGRCAICFKQSKLCVDHDHATNKVRELLCPRCNIAIGLIDEDIKRVDNLRAYLLRHRSVLKE